MTTIFAHDLEPGDIVDYHGALHQITQVHRGDGWAWPVAYDDTGWAMALGRELVVALRSATRGRPAIA